MLFKAIIKNKDLYEFLQKYILDKKIKIIIRFKFELIFTSPDFSCINLSKFSKFLLLFVLFTTQYFFKKKNQK